MSEISTCSIIFFVLVLNIAKALGRVTFTKTYGDIIQMEDNTRYPERCFIIDCLSKCEIKQDCYCSRVSTESQFSTCENFNNQIDINTYNKSGYVYYAFDRYKDTLGKESIALRKPAHQSSVYELKDVKYSADKAVDGFRHVDGFTKPYFAHTDDSNVKANRFPWWQVDLKEEHVITGVNVLNRKLWAERLHDFEIRVGNQRLTPIFRDKHFTDNVLCAEHLGAGIADNETVKFQCHPCPVRGRYVSIQIVRFCAKCAENSMNVLQLAEVDVFGFKAEE